MPPIELLPKELRIEIFAWLDRVSVERSMSVSRRFRTAADALMLTGQVPLRILPHITFSSDAFFDYTANSTFALNDDGILAYLFASGSNGTRWLELYNAGATEELPRKMVEMKTRTEGTRVAFRFRMFVSHQKLTEYRRILRTMGLRRHANAKGYFYRSDDNKIGFHITKNLTQPCFYANMSSE
ncbi:hypothetical protein AAVH_31455 [Aphelenchoides avenae]|nr:hypothetical protein AAVH_31455 [Aphelenchus avenae]